MQDTKKKKQDTYDPLKRLVTMTVATSKTHECVI